MGLCKCPQKKVTNQFCFEHRVNVCEHCMVNEHPKCVVQSYLQWLSNSDYNPVCQLCQEDLVSSSCVRLVCYDLFHVNCLSEWAGKLPSNTAPDGYRCPVCSSPIFPAHNLISPIAETLKEVLSNFSWARVGLGMPLVLGNFSSNDSSSGTLAKLAETHVGKMEISRGIPDGHDMSMPLLTNESIEHTSKTTLANSQHRNTNSAQTQNYSRSSSVSVEVDADADANKYRKRSALDWFNRWLRTFKQPSSRHHQGLLGGRRRMGLILAFVSLVSIIVIVSYYGGHWRNDDPMLDPFNNPNIRVEDV